MSILTISLESSWPVAMHIDYLWNLDGRLHRPIDYLWNLHFRSALNMSILTVFGIFMAGGICILTIFLESSWQAACAH